MTSALPPAPPTHDPPSGQFPPPPPGPAARPPLRRSRTDKVIGGVSGGLAEYTGIDSLLWRVGFIAVTLAAGTGVVVYALLWLLMPRAPIDPAAEAARARQEPAGPRSPVPGITVAAVLILAGIGVLLGRFTDLDLGARGFLGTAVLLVGIGLVAAAVTGASRRAKTGLIALGAVLSLAAVLATTVHVDGGHGAGDRTYRPATADAVQPRYDGGVGDLTVDLSSVDVSGLTAPVATRVNSGIGDVRVIVPRSADVDVSVANGLGSSRVFGDTSDSGLFPGVGSASWTGDGVPEFRITVESGIGDVEVSRG
jgi:phage shock protein PspC (stress-responsive transcriptional regulator)